MDELLARLRAAIRRGSAARPQPVVVTGDFTIDLGAGRVTAADGSDIRLTPTEWHLLEVLARNAGRVVDHARLLTEVWGPATAIRPTTCGSTWPRCAASSKRTPPIRGTCSPRAARLPLRALTVSAQPPER